MAGEMTNIGQGMSEAFARGASVVPDLSARIQNLMDTSMNQKGAMERTQVSEQGQTERTKIAAGYTKNAQGQMEPGGFSDEEMAAKIHEIQQTLGLDSTVTLKSKSGHTYTVKGAAQSPEDKAMKYTAQLARSLYSNFDIMEPAQRKGVLMSLYDDVAAKFGIGPLAPKDGEAGAAGSPQVSAARTAMISNIPQANRGSAIGGTSLAAGVGMTPSNINTNPMVVGNAAASTGNRIRVMNRQGQTGTILEEEFDPNLYKRI